MAEASVVDRSGDAARQLQARHHGPDIDPIETAEWLESLAFVLETKGKDRAAYLLSVLEALNTEVPIPPGAGPSGGSQFWIAAEFDDTFYAVVGGEAIGGLWDQCQTDCIASVRVPPLPETLPAVLADFTLQTSEPTSTTIASSNLPTSRSVNC